MPIEIRRFGAGHRRPEGPPGTVGVSRQAIHRDSRGALAELAFGTGARSEPHSNPNTTWFVVIEGGGWVQVADERAGVAAGEAVHWPAGVIHAAGTEHARMRAIVVELAAAEHLGAEGAVDRKARQRRRAGEQLRVRGKRSPPAGGRCGGGTWRKRSSADGVRRTR